MDKTKDEGEKQAPRLKIREIKEIEAREWWDTNPELRFLVYGEPRNYGEQVINLLYTVGVEKVTITSDAIHHRGKGEEHVTSVRIYCEAEKEKDILAKLEDAGGFSPNALWRHPSVGGFRCLELWWD